jgi:hypothetical protein
MTRGDLRYGDLPIRILPSSFMTQLLLILLLFLSSACQSPQKKPFPHPSKGSFRELIARLCESGQIAQGLVMMDRAFIEQQGSAAQRRAIYEDLQKLKLIGRLTSPDQCFAEFKTALRTLEHPALRTLSYQLIGRLAKEFPRANLEPWRRYLVDAFQREGPAGFAGLVQAAGMLGGDSLLNELEDMHDAWLRPARRLMAVRALAYQSAKPRVQNLLVNRLDDWNEEVRAETFKILLKQVQTPDRRRIALRALGESEAVACAGVAVIHSGASSTEALAVMRRFENDPPKDPVQKERVFSLLAVHGPVEFLAVAMSWGLGSPGDFEVLYQRAIKENKVFEVLRRCLGQKSKVARRFALSRVFERPGEETGFSQKERRTIALYVLKTDDSRENLIDALFYLRSEMDKPEVRDAHYELVDENGLVSVRLEALRGLMTKVSRESYQALRLGLEDGAAEVRQYCLLRWGEQSHGRGFEILLSQVGANAEDQRVLQDAIYRSVEGLGKERAMKKVYGRCLDRLRRWAHSPDSQRALFALKGLSASQSGQQHGKALPDFTEANLKALRAILLAPG